MDTFALSELGLPQDEVLRLMREARANDADWKAGRVWSMVYYAKELSEFKKQVYSEFIYENGLGPMTFRCLRKFENEVVAMTARMLGGDAAVAGSLTSGGSESILMAVKSARDRAREERPEIPEPELLLPASAHPAFDKAAHYLGLRSVKIPLTTALKPDLRRARELIGPSTVMMVGSAFDYPFGGVDPIRELAAIAAEHDVWFHVDSCMGGFLLPWVRKLGYPVPAFDFSVPGVTSISADVHKFGFAAKGASVVLYRDASLRRHQYFVETEWSGGLYGTPTLTGARPGGAIATAWAVMRHLGEEGYLRLAKGMMETRDRMLAAIRAIPELRVLGDPAATVFAFTSDVLSPFELADLMSARGWYVERQHLPPAVHLMVTPAHAEVCDAFLVDLREAVGRAKTGGATDLSDVSAMYGMVGTLPDRSQARDVALEVLGGIYSL